MTSVVAKFNLVRNEMVESGATGAWLDRLLTAMRMHACTRTFPMPEYSWDIVAQGDAESLDAPLVCPAGSTIYVEKEGNSAAYIMQRVIWRE